LLDGSADVHQRMNGGATALFLASQCGHLTVVQALVDAEADVNVVDHNGITPAMVTPLRGRDELLRLLEARPANADVSQEEAVRSSLPLANAESGHSQVLLRQPGQDDRLSSHLSHATTSDPRCALTAGEPHAATSAPQDLIEVSSRNQRRVPLSRAVQCGRQLRRGCRTQ